MNESYPIQNDITLCYKYQNQRIFSSNRANIGANRFKQEYFLLWYQKSSYEKKRIMR